MTELRERMRKLSDEQILAIRRRYVPRDPVNSAYAMAREFGVRPNTIFRVLAREVRAGWDHVEATE
jgi:DNA-binding transcriptional regulator YhcF (GntR family)